MTKQEAIKILNKYDLNFCDIDGNPIPPQDLAEAFDMAIKALEQEPCEDCISRKWVLDKIHTYAEADTTSTGGSIGAECCAEFVKDAPCVVPSRETGKWIADRYCSECEWDKKDVDYTSGWTEDYCPNCGARMESDTE